MSDNNEVEVGEGMQMIHHAMLMKQQLTDSNRNDPIRSLARNPPHSVEEVVTPHMRDWVLFERRYGWCEAMRGGLAHEWSTGYAL